MWIIVFCKGGAARRHLFLCLYEAVYLVHF